MTLELKLLDAEIDSADAIVLSAKGAIDLAHAPLLDQAFERLHARGARHVAVDLAGVKYVSSSGIAVLVKHAQALEAAGGGLSLLGVTDKVRVVLEMLGVEPVFSVVCNRRPLAAAFA